MDESGEGKQPTQDEAQNKFSESNTASNLPSLGGTGRAEKVFLGGTAAILAATGAVAHMRGGEVHAEPADVSVSVSAAADPNHLVLHEPPAKDPRIDELVKRIDEQLAKNPVQEELKEHEANLEALDSNNLVLHEPPAKDPRIDELVKRIDEQLDKNPVQEELDKHEGFEVSLTPPKRETLQEMPDVDGRTIESKLESPLSQELLQHSEALAAFSSNLKIDEIYDANVSTGAETTRVSEAFDQNMSVFDVMFHDVDGKEKEDVLKSIKNYQKTTSEGGIGTLQEMPAMTQLLQRETTLPNGEVITFKNYIDQLSVEYGINPNIAMGIFFIESHGDIEAYNNGTGATGIGQFLTAAGIRHNLIEVDDNGKTVKDLRTDPFASAEATFKYLNDIRDLFNGDIGLAVWGYHAGEGNVIGAMRAYISEVKGQDIGSFDATFEIADSDARREAQIAIFTKINDFLQNNPVNVETILNSASANSFVSQLGLEDDTQNYPIKAAAAGEYFENLN